MVSLKTLQTCTTVTLKTLNILVLECGLQPHSCGCKTSASTAENGPWQVCCMMRAREPWCSAFVSAFEPQSTYFNYMPRQANREKEERSVWFSFRLPKMLWHSCFNACSRVFLNSQREVQGDGDERQTVDFWSVVALIFFNVSGGPFGSPNSRPTKKLKT